MHLIKQCSAENIHKCYVKLPTFQIIGRAARMSAAQMCQMLQSPHGRFVHRKHSIKQWSAENKHPTFQIGPQGWVAAFWCDGQLLWVNIPGHKKIHKSDPISWLGLNRSKEPCLALKTSPPAAGKRWSRGCWSIPPSPRLQGVPVPLNLSFPLL